MSVMLYRHPGPHHFPQHGGWFDYIVVPETDVTGKLREGWHRTCQDALKPADPVPAPAPESVPEPVAEPQEEHVPAPAPVRRRRKPKL